MSACETSYINSVFYVNPSECHGTPPAFPLSLKCYTCSYPVKCNSHTHETLTRTRNPKLEYKPNSLSLMQNKIDRGIQKYDCDNLRTQIVREYTNKNTSLRDLETVINTKFTAGALKQAGHPTDYDPETVYHELTENNTAFKTDLEEAGVPVDELINDYIAFRTVKNYLNNTLDIDTSKTPAKPVETAKETLNWAQTQHEGVINTTVQRLDNNDTVSIPDNATISVNVDPLITVKHDDKPNEYLNPLDYISKYKQETNIEPESESKH